MWQAGRPGAPGRVHAPHACMAGAQRLIRREGGSRAAPHNTHVHAACLLLLRVPAPAHALQLSIGPYGQQRRHAQMSVHARTRASTHAAQQAGGSKLGRTAEDRLGGGVGAGGVGVRGVWLLSCSAASCRSVAASFMQHRLASSPHGARPAGAPQMPHSLPVRAGRSAVGARGARQVMHHMVQIMLLSIQAGSSLTRTFWAAAECPCMGRAQQQLQQQQHSQASSQSHAGLTDDVNADGTPRAAATAAYATPAYSDATGAYCCLFLRGLPLIAAGPAVRCGGARSLAVARPRPQNDSRCDE